MWQVTGFSRRFPFVPSGRPKRTVSGQLRWRGPRNTPFSTPELFFSVHIWLLGRRSDFRNPVGNTPFYGTLRPQLLIFFFAALNWNRYIRKRFLQNASILCEHAQWKPYSNILATAKQSFPKSFVLKPADAVKRGLWGREWGARGACYLLMHIRKCSRVRVRNLFWSVGAHVVIPHTGRRFTDTYHQIQHNPKEPPVCHRIPYRPPTH